ncbi:hypothetical protein TNIN_372341 [Trichonephila inaurata madagascariensis]|uniref:Uncharacterized protein n=1 Tax=Trichonephila inaurata madagascariensis TaxID=2747483 RepID=A0A8X6YC19_9ARAC|nr:hypothetical protein TNIN_372341 [Trichonephila inaurata madagascariensis]
MLVRHLSISTVNSEQSITLDICSNDTLPTTSTGYGAARNTHQNIPKDRFPFALKKPEGVQYTIHSIREIGNLYTFQQWMESRLMQPFRPSWPGGRLGVIYHTKFRFRKITESAARSAIYYPHVPLYSSKKEQLKEGQKIRRYRQIALKESAAIQSLQSTMGSVKIKPMLDQS